MKIPPRVDICVEFRARVIAFRYAKHRSQQEVATAAGISQGLLSRIESGALSPTLSQIARIADALGVGARRLLFP